MMIRADRPTDLGCRMSHNPTGAGPAAGPAGARPFDLGRLMRQPLVGRILRFGFIGVVVNAVYAGMFFLLTTTHVGSRFIAGAASYALACAVQYCANALFTFRRRILKLEQIVRYLVVVAFGCAASSAFLAYISPSLSLPDTAALLLVMFSMPAVNFVLFLRFVYK